MRDCHLAEVHEAPAFSEITHRGHTDHLRTLRALVADVFSWQLAHDALYRALGGSETTYGRTVCWPPLATE